MTRDDAGRFYLAGTIQRSGRPCPVFVQALPQPGDLGRPISRVLGGRAG